MTGRCDEGRTETFPFWTGGELARIGLMAGLLAAPLATIGTETSALIGQAAVAGGGSLGRQGDDGRAGGLRAVRVTRLDMRVLGDAALADRDE